MVHAEKAGGSGNGKVACESDLPGLSWSPSRKLDVNRAYARPTARVARPPLYCWRYTRRRRLLYTAVQSNLSSPSLSLFNSSSTLFIPPNTS